MLPQEPLSFDDELTAESKQVLNNRVKEYTKHDFKWKSYDELRNIIQRSSLIVTFSESTFFSSGMSQGSLSPLSAN